MREIEEATVHLTVPNDLKYLGLVRLLVASSAADVHFSYDAIEDLRIVADELIHLVMTAAAPGANVRIGVFPGKELFEFRGSAPLPTSAMVPAMDGCRGGGTSEAPVATAELDVLAAQIVAALVDNFQIETIDGRIEVAFSLRCPTGPNDG
jgi:hypothetical protein